MVGVSRGEDLCAPAPQQIVAEGQWTDMLREVVVTREFELAGYDVALLRGAG
jgi:hypothetical protein